MIRPVLTRQERSFSDYIISHLRAFATTIDVTEFVNANRWDRDRVQDLFMNVLWNTPEVFYVSKRVRYEDLRAPDDWAEYACFTGIRYSIRPSEYEACWKQLKQEVARALKTVRGVSSPEIIALRLHDHLVRICDYDLDAAEKRKPSAPARNAYSVLIRHKAVCEGYTMAYRLLLNAAGILSEEIISPKMGHCWNYVYLRGHWYHVDVTFDDPVWWATQMEGRRRGEIDVPLPDAPICHDNFLMSDRQAVRTGHTAWLTRGLPSANDTAFDGRCWEV